MRLIRSGGMLLLRRTQRPPPIQFRGAGYPTRPCPGPRDRDDWPMAPRSGGLSAAAAVARRAFGVRFRGRGAGPRARWRARVTLDEYPDTGCDQARGSAPAKGVSFMRERFNQAADRVNAALGTVWALIASVLIVAVWALTGPIFQFSD
ncbi:MAG: low affinity iron permease family protein, partial [Candidatus Limnocylindrales bacterium]